MDTGVLGVPFPFAVSPAERVLKNAPDLAITKQYRMEIQFVLEKSQKLFLAMHRNAQLVK
jgi:hypothetical protein